MSYCQIAFPMPSNDTAISASNLVLFFTGVIFFFENQEERRYKKMDVLITTCFCTPKYVSNRRKNIRCLCHRQLSENVISWIPD
jgi:hypothetical protein